MTQISPFDLVSILLTLSAALAYLNYRLLKLPLTVGLLIGAVAGTMVLIAIDGFVPSIDLKNQIRGLLAAIDFPTTLLNGFLAFLLFAGALHVNSADMFARKWTILALASFATVLSTGLIGVSLFAVAMVFSLGIPLAWCLVFGALISPTDPVSVLDALKRVGISRHLQATIAGESLFNDGVGVVLFTLMLTLTTSGHLADFGPIEIIRLFLVEAVGGGWLGLVLGYAAFLLILQVDDYNVELLVSLALAAGTYSLAGFLQVSGPIAVVVAGILFGNHGMHKGMTQSSREHLDTFWHLVEGILNAVLFVMIGLEIAAIDLDGRAMGALALMIPIVLVIRWLSVTASAMPLNLHIPTARRRGSFLVLTWGGLRGGLSVAMALSLPESPSKAPILTLAYGVVVFSIIVQGLTLERVARRFLAHP